MGRYNPFKLDILYIAAVLLTTALLSFCSLQTIKLTTITTFLYGRPIHDGAFHPLWCSYAYTK